VIWSDIFLGVIAAATAAIAVVQIGMLVAAGRLARRIALLLDQLEAEVKPLFDHLNAIGRDATRAAALASAQVERVDRLANELASRAEQGVQTLQDTLAAPAREGRAVVGALLAAIRAMRQPRRRHSRTEEDDALFI
jgi:hypothetical protein